MPNKKPTKKSFLKTAMLGLFITASNALMGQENYDSILYASKNKAEETFKAYKDIILEKADSVDILSARENMIQSKEMLELLKSSQISPNLMPYYFIKATFYTAVYQYLKNQLVLNSNQETSSQKQTSASNQHSTRDPARDSEIIDEKLLRFSAEMSAILDAKISFKDGHFLFYIPETIPSKPSKTPLRSVPQPSGQ